MADGIASKVPVHVRLVGAAALQHGLRAAATTPDSCLVGRHWSEAGIPEMADIQIPGAAA
ncbi:hypothetical protein AB0C52_33220 [Streptomyces sp. NPDC048717]|uniref:hypothetical protein n=1 Tax=Streptomyces sp. NPDC048717 TaxID=3154928 RepID=UPI0034124D32